MQKQLGWLGVLGVFAALVLPTPAIEAQNPDYVLFVEDQAVPAEGSFPVEILLDNSQGEAAYAWTFGVCHDPAALSVTSADLSDRVEDLMSFEELDAKLHDPEGLHKRKWQTLRRLQEPDMTKVNQELRGYDPEDNWRQHYDLGDPVLILNYRFEE